MANRAYVRFWMRDDLGASREERRLEYFQRFLETVPLSAERPGFSSLVVRAVNPAEIPVLEQDLRGAVCTAADVAEMVRPYSGPAGSPESASESAVDTAWEVGAAWDLWRRNRDAGQWEKAPEPLLLISHGREYDDGVASESGDFLADLGFEHMFTGHGRLLGPGGARSAPADPVEAEFLAVMLHEDHLHQYYEKTRENIQILLRWIADVERALPVERFQLWSEGEENLEARLDEILAVH